MRHRTIITADLPQAVISLPWRADTMSIDNPTLSALYVREGGTDYPQATNYDKVVPGGVFREFPVGASEFAVQFASDFPTGFAGGAATAVITLSQNEKTGTASGFGFQSLSLADIRNYPFTIGNNATSPVIDLLSWGGIAVEYIQDGAPSGEGFLILEGSDDSATWVQITLLPSWQDHRFTVLIPRMRRFLRLRTTNPYPDPLGVPTTFHVYVQARYTLAEVLTLQGLSSDNTLAAVVLVVNPGTDKTWYMPSTLMQGARIDIDDVDSLGGTLTVEVYQAHATTIYSQQPVERRVLGAGAKHVTFHMVHPSVGLAVKLIATGATVICSIRREPLWYPPTHPPILGQPRDIAGDPSIYGQLQQVNSKLTSPVIVDTELPAAAVLSDTLANPTTPQIGADLLGWHPTSSVWKRLAVPHRAVLLASAVHSTATSGLINIPPGIRAVLVVLNVTVNPGGAQTLAFRLLRFTASFFEIVLAPAAQAYGGGAGATWLQVGPENGTVPLAGAGSAAIQTYLTELMQWDVTHSGAGNWTYSIEIAYMA